jgi:hypothetical protein
MTEAGEHDMGQQRPREYHLRELACFRFGSADKVEKLKKIKICQKLSMFERL